MKIKIAKLVSSEPRQLNQKAFVDYIVRGMKDAWHNIFLMTGHLDSEVKPEYITTSAICFSLAENAGVVRGGESFLVKAEHDVIRLCKVALLAAGKSKVDVKLLGIRRGRVDISIGQYVNGFFVPCAVVENKSYVRLKRKSNAKVELYPSDWAKVCEDIKRNIGILKSEVGEVVSNTASTFYVSNSDLVIKSDGEDFLKRLKKEAEGCVKRDFDDLITGVNVCVDVFEIESNLYESREDAEGKDEQSGCPEYIVNGNWFLAGVVIAISR